MEQLIIQEKHGANYILMELEGTVNSYTFGDFQKKSYEYIQETNLVLDLSAVTEIDSSGIGILMGVYNDSETFNTTLYLMRPSLPVVESLEATGFFDEFHRIFSVTEVV